MTPTAVFLVHLLQDVPVLRPLIFMSARDFGFETKVLVSDRFRGRDTSGIWQSEIESICRESGAGLHSFADDWQAHCHLTGQGLIFAASESHIHNHSIAHNIFRHAPASFLKVTLQHGFECVGFRHGEDHVRAYGRTASFAADILCGWCGPEHLSALAPSQLPKLFVTGPSSVLQMATGGEFIQTRLGLVCENLHSIRFESADKLEEEFLKTFRHFAGTMGREGRQIRLRPHPGGQYSAKANAVLPRNVKLENAPLYRLDLRQFCYGISPPSSVLIDLLLAGVPTAVWRDRRGRIDVSNYQGLPTVSSSDELIRFAKDAERDRDRLVANQRRWLEQQGMPLDPADVYMRFAKLFETAERMAVRRPGSQVERERILIVTDEDAAIPPAIGDALTALTANGELTSRTVPLNQIASPRAPAAPVNQRPDLAVSLDAYDPSILLLLGNDLRSCEPIISWAKNQRAALIYVLRPDQPAPSNGADIQERWFEEIMGSIHLLREVDLIYAPSEEQKVRLERAFPGSPTVVAAGADREGRPRKPSALRESLLDIIARGHAAVRTQNRQPKKEVRVCQVP